MNLRGKKITVVGLARSGAGAAKLLSRMGADVTVTDSRRPDELAESLKLLPSSIKLSLGGHPKEIFIGADMIVVSPGVPLSIEPLVAAKKKGVSVISELELAYQVMESQTRFLAVTGSNGKSTTTTLLDLMIRKGGYSTVFGGNIGNALTEEIFELNIGNSTEKTISKAPDFFVVEVSSFQLEAVEKFRPAIASILNITPDHLDRYHSMNEYSEAKSGIFLNQRRGDYLLLNADDPETMKLYESRLKDKGQKRPEVYFFSRKKEVKGIYCKNGVIYCGIPDSSYAICPIPVITVEDIKIKGVHNLENAMAASAMALLAACPIQAVNAALREFGGLEHRLELVRVLDGVTYINDSKGTNVGAVEKSVESFNEPLILIAGGRDKAGDFRALRELVSKKVKALVLIGEAAKKIEAALGDITTTILADDLKVAVKMSREIAKKGDVVLLSPACASFDMFRDYEDRGRQFKTFVGELRDYDK